MGTIDAQYAVTFTTPGRVGVQQSTVALTTDYTAFEDIRKILSLRAGCPMGDVKIVTATLVI